MAFHQQLVEVFNRPIPLPAVLEKPVRFPKLLGDEDLREMERCIEYLLSWLRPAGRRPSVRRRAAKLFSLEGTVKGFKTGGFCIDGTHFYVNEETFVVGDLKTDVGAKVKGLQLPDGKRIATAIVIKECEAPQRTFAHRRAATASFRACPPRPGTRR